MALTVGLVLSFVATWSPSQVESADSHGTANGDQVWRASWAKRPASLKEIKARATAVVEAEVTRIESGPDLVVPDRNEPNGEIRIPTQRVGFRRLDTYAGAVESDFSVFKTGSSSVSLEGDPPYAVGERYVLFIAPRMEGDGSYLPAGPDGRLREDDRSQVQAVIPGPVADALDGKPKSEVKAAVRD